jgi:4-aminobutyrate--pyruvate transaminase
LRNLQIIEAEQIPANAARAGAHLLAELKGLEAHPHVGNVRGKGCMLMVEVVADKATKAKFDPALNVGGKLQAATRARGVIVRCSNDGMAIAPVLTIRGPEEDHLINAIAEAVDEVLSPES